MVPGSTVGTSGLVVAAAFAGLLFSRSTLAQQPRNPTASHTFVRRELIDEAQRESAAGHHDRALELALRAGEIETTPSLRVFIAQEQAATGNPAAALSSAEQCLRELERDTSIRERNLLLTTCRGLRESLRGEVARITIQAPAIAVPGLRVTVAGDEIPSVLFGIATPVSPGKVVVEATGTDVEPFHTELQLARGDSNTVALWGGHAPTPVATPITGPIVTTPIVAPVVPPPPPPRGMSAGPIVLGVAGAVALLVVVPLGVARNGALTVLEAQCTGVDKLDCPEGARGTFNEASGLTLGANLSVIAGITLLTAGTTWLIIDSVSRSRERVSAMLVPTTHGVQLSVSGSF